MAALDSTTKQIAWQQRLALLLATGLLSTALLLSGCSNNDNGEVDSINTTEKLAESADTSIEDNGKKAVKIGDSNHTTRESESSAITADSAPNKTPVTSDKVNPVTNLAQQKSLVTNPTQIGTPEDTVKKALDSLYYGDAKQAATYYQVDMADFESELVKTQPAFQQTVDGVTFATTKYNDDKTRATITGELMLKGQSKPESLAYELQKIDGKWKILG